MTPAPEGWINWRDVALPAVLDVPYAARAEGNQGTRVRHNIKDLLCAFDIETSKVPGLEESVCYHWQLQLGFDYPTIEGRELWEFRAFMDRLACLLAKDETIVIYVHNLHYEFHFLRSVYPDIRNEEVFAVGPRKPVKLSLYEGRVVFKCSYILTNMSLGQWTAKMGVEYGKLDGDKFDYEKTRMPWDPLTDYELEYCRNDVLGLIEALKVQLDTRHDTLATVPLTSTGYVRRDVKRVMRNWSYWGLQSVQPAPEVYIALRQAFRGGDTHANRYYAGVILDDVGSSDRSSSYPEVCINHEFPMGTLRRESEESLRQLRRCIRLHRACLVRIYFTGLRLRDPYDPCPYISYAKVMEVDRNRLREYILDNGRIMSAPCGSLTMTDVDWQIFEKQYTWDTLEVTDLWTTKYDFLPDMLRALIISYYDNKTRLKGVAGQELYYDLAKALLNSIYGLQAQDPCKPSTVYNVDHDPDRDLFYLEEGDIPALLRKSAKQPYGSYQWGVWVTAWARWELRQAIDLAGDNFVYCDTDSVKYVGDLDLSGYNKAKVKLSHANGAEATDPQGVTHYMGVFEDEGRTAFRTWGAKKYCTVKEGKVKLTVAGVGKKAGAAELLQAAEAQGVTPLEAFTPGMIFHAAGGVDAVYNDYTNRELEISGHKLYVGPNIYLRPSTYELGIKDDYAQILDDAELIRRLIHNRNIEKALSHTGTK